MRIILKSLFMLMVFGTSFSSCKTTGCTNPIATNYSESADEDDCSCEFYVDDMIGTFTVTITSYPRQPSEEGRAFDMLTFIDYSKCATVTLDDLKEIKFNNLFKFYDCSILPLDQYTFTVTLDDNEYWAGAPLEGEGTIVHGVFHFEGIIYTSAGQFPIVLDGIKISSERRTDAC